MNNLTRILFLLSCFYLSGCATTYKDFKTSEIKANEGVAIGKVNIKYNGKDMNKDCAICLNSINGPCQNLTEDGIVFKNIPKGDATLRRVVCKDSSMQHYNIEGAKFVVADDINYFGEVNIEWANKGGFKASDMFGAIGAIVSESSNDGTIKLSVKEGNMKEVVRAYEQQTKLENVKTSKTLIRVVQ